MRGHAKNPSRAPISVPLLFGLVRCLMRVGVARFVGLRRLFCAFARLLVGSLLRIELPVLPVQAGHSDEVNLGEL